MKYNNLILQCFLLFFWHEVLKICLGCSNIGHMLSFISSAPTYIIKNIIFHKIYEYHLCYIIILHVFMINKQQLSLSLARVCISVLIYAYLCLLDLEHLFFLLQDSWYFCFEGCLNKVEFFMQLIVIWSNVKFI